MAIRERGREPAGHEPGAVRKALALLEAVAQLGSGATARDISRRSGIPPATAYRLLNLLVADGYLVRISDLSGFALGRRTRELAGPHEDVGDEAEPAPDVVAELRAQVRFGIFVVSYAHGRIRLVDRDPDHELVGEAAIRTHLHASAIGKLLLAQRPELAPAALRPITPRTITGSDALTAELDAIRATGVAREVDEIRLGRSALAVPVRHRGCTVGCLVAIGRTGRIPVHDDDLVQLLHEFAARAHPVGVQRC